MSQQLRPIPFLYQWPGKCATLDHIFLFFLFWHAVTAPFHSNYSQLGTSRKNSMSSYGRKKIRSRRSRTDWMRLCRRSNPWFLWYASPHIYSLFVPQIRTAEKFRTFLAAIYAGNYCRNPICMHAYFVEIYSVHLLRYASLPRSPACGHTFCLQCIGSWNLAPSHAESSLPVSAYVWRARAICFPDFVSVLQLSVLLAVTLNSGVA